MLFALCRHRPSESLQPPGHRVRLCWTWELTQASLPNCALVGALINFIYSSTKYCSASSHWITWNVCVVVRHCFQLNSENKNTWTPGTPASQITIQNLEPKMICIWMNGAKAIFINDTPQIAVPNWGWLVMLQAILLFIPGYSDIYICCISMAIGHVNSLSPCYPRISCKICTRGNKTTYSFIFKTEKVYDKVVE